VPAKELPVSFLDIGSVTLPIPSKVHGHVEGADCNADCGNYRIGNVRVDKAIEPMQQKSPLVWANAGMAFKELFGEGKGTRPQGDFDDNAPYQRNNVKNSEDWTSARPERPEDNPHYPGQMNGQDESG
jgi:hypothetical protein